MARIVKHHPVLFSFAFLLLAIPLVLRLAATNVSAQIGQSAVLPADLEVALLRAGLDPEVLAAAGLDANQTASVVSGFETAMALEPDRLAQADTRHADARVLSDSLRRTIQSGKGNALDVAAYQQAMSDLTAAEAEREDALNDCLVAAVAGLSPVQVSTLNTIDGNRDWGLDLEMLALDRTEAEWVKLRDALTHERVAAKYSEPVEPAVAAYLATCRSAPEIAAAKTNLDANGTLIAAAFETAVQ